MSTGIGPQPAVIRQVPIFRHERRPFSRPPRLTYEAMKHVSATSSSLKKEVRGEEVIHTTVMPNPPLKMPESLNGLRFDRIRVPELDSGAENIRVFGNFVAREALLDEEFWTAAWLRAESHWEGQPSSRYVDSHKKKFADQEFAAIKRRCNGRLSEKSTCIVAVKKEVKNVKQTILKSIVGTLDISIRHLLKGETFPGDRHRPSPVLCLYRTDQPRYGYISNVCVAKYARRQGVATNMLHLALHATRLYGVDKVFIHVDRNNYAAQKLYEKMGFQMVETDTDFGSDNSNCLLCVAM